jgi:uncharacterized protein
MPKITVPIRGMHCHSCELLVEQNIKKIKGVVKVRAKQKSGLAEVYYENIQPTPLELSQAVKNAGYEVGNKEKLPWFSKDWLDYKDLFKAAVILIVLYFTARFFGLFNLNVNTSSTSLGIVLLVGLVAGVSTCMAMVGGLVLGLSARHAELHPETTLFQKFKPHLFFNLGRIFGFTLLGGLIGLIGKALTPSANFLGVLTIIIGGVMIFLGLKLIEVFPALRDKTISLPAGIAKIFGLHKETKTYSTKSALLTGALTFFLPCGFTQAMQLYAVSSGSFLKGAAIMSFFAIGTAPGLLSVGGLSSIFKGNKARVFYMIAGLAVIGFGWFNISNGSQLISTGRTTINNSDNNQTGVQIIRMTQDAYGYKPNSFTVEKGRPVKWIINSTTPFSCAASIVMPAYNISQGLKAGENIIEFTPTKTGEIPFTCSMGMYRGKFIVTDSRQTSGIQKTYASTNDPNANTLGSAGGCGCGGGSKPFIPNNSDPSQPQILNNEQTIKATYTLKDDLQPNTFTVKKDLLVNFEVSVSDNGQGCMSTIMIPGLYSSPQYLKQGDNLVMKFTPDKTGDYQITCAMGVPRGLIKVID